MTVAIDHGQCGDAVFPHQCKRLVNRVAGIDGHDVATHQILDPMRVNGVLGRHAYSQFEDSDLKRFAVQ